MFPQLIAIKQVIAINRIFVFFIFLYSFFLFCLIRREITTYFAKSQIYSTNNQNLYLKTAVYTDISYLLLLNFLYHVLKQLYHALKHLYHVLKHLYHVLGWKIPFLRSLVPTWCRSESGALWSHSLYI